MNPIKWATALVVGLAATALAVAQVDFDFFRVSTNARPEDLRYYELTSQRGRAHAELAELMRRDSLLPLLDGADGPIIQLHPELDTTAARVVSREVQAQLRSLGTSRSRLGIFVIDRSYGSLADYFGRASTQYYTGINERGPYCLAVGLADRMPNRGTGNTGEVLRYNPRRFGDWSGRPPPPTTGNVLGPCVFWARYGAPGPQIRQWLNQGGHYFADAPAEWLDSTGVRPWSIDHPDRKYWRRYSQGLGCLSGREDECRRMFLDPGSDPRSTRSALGVYSSFSRYVFGPGDAALLAHLEKEFGPERFQRFWSATQPVEPAFEAAFDVAASSWVRAWAQRNFGQPPAGPAMKLGTVGLSLVTILALVGVALAVGSRRSIG